MRWESRKGGLIMKHALRIMAIITILILTVANISFPAVDYPTKPITLISPFPAGGSRDIVGRMFASVAEKYLGKPMVVINKPGASGMIGGVAIVQAVPDGYTLGLSGTSDTNAIEWEIVNGRKPGYTRHDLILIGSFTKGPVLVVVPYSSPWKTLADLIKDLKAKPGHYAFCSGGLYNVTHISTEILMRATGTKARLVPYTGGGPCLAALVGGHVDFTTQFLSSSIPLTRGNKLRILAVMGDTRIKSIPEVPNVKELGIDAETYQMIGVSAPKKTPTPIVEKLREVLRKVADDKSFISMIEDYGDEVLFTNGDEFANYWDSYSERLARLFKQLIEEKK